MNQQDQQVIEELFQDLYQTAERAGTRDGTAEALIQRYVQEAPPGLLYQMAQTLVAQQHTLNQLRSQLATYQRQGGAPGGFAAGDDYRDQGDYQGQDPGAFDDGGTFDDNGFAGAGSTPAATAASSDQF